MVQYYTLREAAEKLRMDPERLKEMAKNNQLRAFQDRGTLRFRAQEIEELARSLGLGSDPELQLGELLPPKSGSKPPSSKSPAPSSRRTMHVPDDADLSLVGDDAVPLGDEPGSQRSQKSPQSKSKPGSGKKAGSPSSPPPAHDSDVRLVSDSSDLEFKIEPEDAGKMGQTREAPASSRSPAPKKRPSKLRPDGKPDSGVRVVPLDKASDSDVKIVSDDRASHDPSVILGQSKSKTPSDSDVRLELAPPPSPNRGRDDAFVTEDIELDLEALKEEESKVRRRRPTKSSPELPITSPFELSEEDAPKAGSKPKAKKDDTDSSSDFELTAAGSSSDHSPIELGSDEMPIPLAGGNEEEVILGEVGGPGSHDSGINLRDAKDSGISLEEGGSEEIEFALGTGPTATPKPGPVTPKPAGSAEHDSSAEFELSMDDSPVGEEDHSSSEFELSLDPGTGPEESSSEFELSLDPNATSASKAQADDSSPVDSDSEFELSLDASGEQESAEAGLSEGEKDIFETDFEVPALDDESGSEAVALDESDTDLEDSDFELDLSDEDLAAEEDSGSQAVALEEEAESESSAEVPVSRKPRKKPAPDDSSEESDAPLIDLEDMEGEESEAETEAEPVAAGPGAPPAPWGIVPALFLVPSFIVMIFVVFMSYEMLNTMWGYHTGGIGARMLLNPLAKQIDKEVP